MGLLSFICPSESMPERAHIRQSFYQSASKAIQDLLLVQYLLSCLSGPVGVGLNELKRKLLISDTQHYGVTVPRKFCPV